jgi:hypothetical protein
VQVQLTADYAPSTLLDLLSSSQTVPLEAALAICEAKGLVHEQVWGGGRGLMWGRGRTNKRHLSRYILCCFLLLLSPGVHPRAHGQHYTSAAPHH